MVKSIVSGKNINGLSQIVPTDEIKLYLQVQNAGVLIIYAILYHIYYVTCYVLATTTSVEKLHERFHKYCNRF